MLAVLRSAAIGVVSVENPPCFIILMAVSNCIISEQQVAPAAEVAAPTASPPLAEGLRPRLTGQGLVRTQAWLLRRAGRRGAVVTQMIYRGLGWREY